LRVLPLDSVEYFGGSIYFVVEGKSKPKILQYQIKFRVSITSRDYNKHYSQIHLKITIKLV